MKQLECYIKTFAALCECGEIIVQETTRGEVECPACGAVYGALKLVVYATDWSSIEKQTTEEV